MTAEVDAAELLHPNQLIPDGGFCATRVRQAGETEFAYELSPGAIARFAGTGFTYGEGWPSGGALTRVSIEREGASAHLCLAEQALDWSKPTQQLFMSGSGVFNSPFLPALFLRARPSRA